jgi:hypothetical protein
MPLVWKPVPSLPVPGAGSPAVVANWLNIRSQNSKETDFKCEWPEKSAAEF